jgi:hypothetical protein
MKPLCEYEIKILRRAEKRGKVLPHFLQAALEVTAKDVERCEPTAEI